MGILALTKKENLPRPFPVKNTKESGLATDLDLFKSLEALIIINSWHFINIYIFFIHLGMAL